MINQEDRLALRDGDNLSYYQFLGNHAISEYRANVEHSPLDDGEEFVQEEIIDFSNNFVYGSQSLRLRPKSYKNPSSDTEQSSAMTLNLRGNGGRGLYWLPYDLYSGEKVSFRVHYYPVSLFNSQYGSIEISFGSNTYFRQKIMSNNLGSWVFGNITGLYFWEDRASVSIRVYGCEVLIDSIQIIEGEVAAEDFPTPSNNKIDRTLYEYLSEGGLRNLNINNYTENDLVVEEGSIRLIKSLWENKIYGGCIPSQLSFNIIAVNQVLDIGDPIRLNLPIVDKNYVLFNGRVTNIEKDLEHDWFTITALDLLGYNLGDGLNTDITEWYKNLFEVTGIPDESYKGTWDSETVYPENSIVLYTYSHTTEYYTYKFDAEITDWSVGVRFDGETYYDKDSLLTAFKGSNPQSITYIYNHTMYKLPSTSVSPVTYRKKTQKQEYTGVWLSGRIYSMGDVVKVTISNVERYYRYGKAMTWTKNGTQYRVLIQGVRPEAIPERYPDVAQYLVTELEGYDIYDYPTTTFKEFTKLLLRDHGIRLANRLEYDQYFWPTVSYSTVGYNRNLDKINGLEMMRALCQLIAMFGYIDEKGRFNLTYRSEIRNNTVNISDNNYTLSGSKKGDVINLDQVVMNDTKYPVNPSSNNNIIDLSNNIIRKTYEWSSRNINDAVQRVHNWVSSIDKTQNSIEEIIGTFIDIGTTVTVNLSNGETLSFVVSKVEYSGPQLINQKIECAEMF